MPAHQDSAALSPQDLQALWRRSTPDGGAESAVLHPWAAQHRPDWVARGLIVWPRGGQSCVLRLDLATPEPWRPSGPPVGRARLALRWWAEAAELWVQGERVREGDLFDSGCRWPLPAEWWQDEPWRVELRLRSPLHDDGALVLSRLELEPLDPTDPHGILAPTEARLHALWQGAGPREGRWTVLGHAHLDLAWLWPVADTWVAAVRTFRSVLALMERQADLHFGHSTPALYAWLERSYPALYQAVREAMGAGRWEPLNGPWVECDCVLLATASLLRQFQEGQWYSRRAFPEWTHPLAWLPDSFGFSLGVPPVAAATGVRWFCTHKLAWNGSQPFPHRLFRWRGRCGAEVLALMTAPIGTDADPIAMEEHRLAWQRGTGLAEALWLPGVGDHGGGPTLEMLDQLALWQGRKGTAPREFGTLRSFLTRLAPLAPTLPVWRDELYLELHRGCATSRPDQKRHNRTLERLLREADTALALLAVSGAKAAGAGPTVAATDWRPLLFHQFHDILPGTSIPEVFEQAEPLWRRARQHSRRLRDQALRQLLGRPSPGPCPGTDTWVAAQLRCLPPRPRTVRLPEGPWHLQAHSLAGQRAARGGEWVQLPGLDGLGSLGLKRQPRGSVACAPALAIAQPVTVQPLSRPADSPAWRLENGLVAVTLGPRGVEAVADGRGREWLAGPLRWCRYGDGGEFWDAWDVAADYADHPLPWTWDGEPEWVERGPLCAQMVWRGRCGESPVRLDGRLLAGTPWFELVLRVHWRQRHELLRLTVPLATRACRWAADTPGGVIERPTVPRTPREQARWEVAAVSWLASVDGAEGGGLAVLLDGPQGVSAGPVDLGVSLLRAPTWPDPGADNGLQRLRLALMPAGQGWRGSGVPHEADRFREPLWLRPQSMLETKGWNAHLPSQEADVQVIGLERRANIPAEVVLTAQNLGPCRRHLKVGPHWQVIGPLNGLHEDAGEPGPTVLPPWSLSFWRLRRAQSS